eukprot:6204734-Pleurochrysis_carterae.AAC.1
MGKPYEGTVPTWSRHGARNLSKLGHECVTSTIRLSGGCQICATKLRCDATLETVMMSRGQDPLVWPRWEDTFLFGSG